MQLREKRFAYHQKTLAFQEKRFVFHQKRRTSEDVSFSIWPSGSLRVQFTLRKPPDDNQTSLCRRPCTLLRRSLLVGILGTHSPSADGKKRRERVGERNVGVILSYKMVLNYFCLGLGRGFGYKVKANKFHLHGRSQAIRNVDAHVRSEFSSIRKSSAYEIF